MAFIVAKAGSVAFDYLCHGAGADGLAAEVPPQVDGLEDGATLEMSGTQPRHEGADGAQFWVFGVRQSYFRALPLLVSFGAWQEEHRPRAGEGQILGPHVCQLGTAESCGEAQEQERPVPQASQPVENIHGHEAAQVFDSDGRLGNLPRPLFPLDARQRQANDGGSDRAWEARFFVNVADGGEPASGGSWF